MNVTFHVVGNRADEVRQAAEDEIARFFGVEALARLDWTIDCDAREDGVIGGPGTAPAVVRSNYYCRVDVFPRHDRGERAA